MPVIAPSGIGTELPQNVGDLIAATKDILQGTYQSEWLVLANDTDVPASLVAETLTFTTNADGAVRTALISIDDEIMYVLSNPDFNQALVLRGFDRTTPARHTAGSIVEVKPRFPKHIIRRQLAMEIASWPDNLFQVATTTLNVVGDGKTFAYDLGIPSSQVLFLLDVRHAPYLVGQSRNTWTKFQKSPQLNRTIADPVNFPNGVALEIKDDCIPNAAEVKVTYAKPFDISSLDDTIVVGPGGIGLPNSLLDVAALGTAARLLGPREAARTFTESGSAERAQTDVPSGAALRTAAFMKQERDHRVKEEISHLNAAWPMRVK